MDQLGVDWFLRFNANTADIPSGKNKLLYIGLSTDSTVWSSGQAQNIESLTDEQLSSLGFPTRVELQQMAQSSPGSYWYLFGEANRYGFMTGTRFAPVLHYLLTNLKQGDPTAKIVGSSILNWDFTCRGCDGYQRGEVWLQELIGAYQSRYGEKPPVDAWAIDVYPIDWNNTPNNHPGKPAFYLAKDGHFPHWSIAIQQIEGMRQYLDTSGYTDTPIWITEIAIHVGYLGWQWITFPTKIGPLGDYHWHLMSDYMNAVLDWLETNSETYNIEKWFFFTTHRDIVDVSLDGYMGIIFFSDPSVGSQPNCLGDVYRARALGQPQVACDATGLTVPR